MILGNLRRCLQLFLSRPVDGTPLHSLERKIEKDARKLLARRCRRHKAGGAFVECSLFCLIATLAGLLLTTRSLGCGCGFHTQQLLQKHLVLPLELLGIGLAFLSFCPPCSTCVWRLRLQASLLSNFKNLPGQSLSHGFCPDDCWDWQDFQLLYHLEAFPRLSSVIHFVMHQSLHRIGFSSQRAGAESDLQSFDCILKSPDLLLCQVHCL